MSSHIKAKFFTNSGHLAVSLPFFTGSEK